MESEIVKRLSAELKKELKHPTEDVDWGRQRQHLEIHQLLRNIEKARVERRRLVALLNNKI